MSWAMDELGSARLKDRRRVRRLIEVVETLAEHMGESVPDACDDWAQTEATYRLWANKHFEPADIYAAHFACTARRAGTKELVLAIMDGSSLDFTGHKATTGLGLLERRYHWGLMIHPTLVVSPDGRVEGLVDMRVWSRPPETYGKLPDRHKRPIVERESYVWLQSWEACQQRLPAHVHVLGVADQEAEMFDLFAAPRRPGADLLVRASGDRLVRHPHRILGDAMRATPVATTFEIEVPRHDDRPSRRATLTLRFAATPLIPPRHGGALRPEVPAWAILVEEEHPPAHTEPLKWLLLTSLPVTSTAEALQMVAYYRLRWLVERFFFVLKQGCQVEELQLEAADRIERALACYSVAAWRQLAIMLDARMDPHGPANTFLSEHELKALVAYHQQKAKRPLYLKQPLRKRDAVRMVAQLGGFLARKGDGEPGPKTIWKGLAHLHDLAAGYQLAEQLHG